MSTEHVLEAIDGALADWETSRDAMRWSPEPEAAPPLMPTHRAAPVCRRCDSPMQPHVAADGWRCPHGFVSTRQLYEGTRQMVPWPTMDDIRAAMEALAHRPPRPVEVRVRSEADLLTHVRFPEVGWRYGALLRFSAMPAAGAQCFGVPVFLDEAVPEGVVRLVFSDGTEQDL